MLLNINFRSVAALLVFVILNVPGMSNEEKWVECLIKNIKIDMEVFQTVMIVSENAKIHDKRISHIVRKIQQEIPSQVLSLRNSTTREARINTPSLFYQSLEGTLLITIPFLKENLEKLEITDTTDFLNQLSTPKTRPKCLMIALPKKGKVSYRALLHNMWSNYFLDFTILEIAEKRVKNNGSLQNQVQLITMVYHFNPFNKIYTKLKYTKKIKLFPNKLRDLNSFEMKVGSFHMLPYVSVERNSSGYPIEVSRPDALVAKAISKNMNFRLSEVPSQEEWFGNLDCNDESKRSGFEYLLGNKTIRFITNQGVMLPNCERQSISSKSTGSAVIYALVPILTAKTDTASPTTKWIYLVLLVFIIRIITIFLKFDKDVWPWFEILRASLGFSVPREPCKLPERIAFLSILIAFSIFSSNLFAMLTDTKLMKKTEKTIDTLEELNMTNLIPTTVQTTVYLMKKQSDPVIQALAHKSNIVLKHEECIEMLVQGKNVACILRESIALIAIKEHKDANNDSVMKIVKDPVFFSQKVMHFEPNSPYIRQVDAIIQRLIQSGLIYHWKKQFLPSEKKSSRSEPDEAESVSILTPLIFFITFGCSFSIVVFICELLIKYIDDRLHGCVIIFSQGSVF